MNRHFSILAAAVLVMSAVGAGAQSRDVRASRIVLDDGNGNTLILQTPVGPIAGGTLLLPDPAGGSGTLLTADNSGNATLSGSIRLMETGGGSDYVGFSAPAAISSSQLWTLPDADGANGDVLMTNGAGVLSWTPSGMSLPFIGTVDDGGYLFTLINTNAAGGGAGSFNINNSTNNGAALTALTTGTGMGLLATSNFSGDALVAQITNPNGTGSAGSFQNLDLTNTSPVVEITTVGPGPALQTSNGNVVIGNSDNVARELRFGEPSGGGSSYVSFKAPALAGNVNFTLPVNDGNANDVLSTDGTGVLSWVAVGAVQTDATLTGDGSSGSPLSVNLGNANTWTGTQTFTNVAATGTSDLQGAISSSTSDVTVGDNMIVTGDLTVMGAIGGTVSGTIPIGGIIMWSGGAGSVPADWALCDGTNGTPDLRGRFIIGSGGAYSDGMTGGAETVDLSHSHGIDHGHSGSLIIDGATLGYTTTAADANGDGTTVNVVDGFTDPHVHTGAITVDDYTGSSTSELGTTNILPPYYALAYIMRIN